jgi:uncharacterized protein YjiS (DUF1127 family)
MSTFTLNLGAVGHASGKPLASFMQSLVALIERRRERARMAQELQSYSNRELFDLGISSADIPAVINGSYRRY